MSDYLDPNNEELLKDYSIEANSQVDTLEQNILVLENEPDNHEAVDEIFRAAHTLKGGAATVQMMELSEFTHLVEDVLDEIRSGNVSVTGAVVDTLLESIDIIKSMLQARSGGGVYDEDVSGLELQLKGLLAAEKTAPPGGDASAESAGKAEALSAPKNGALGREGLSEYELLEMREAVSDDEELFRVTVHFDADNPMNTVGGIQIFAALKGIGSVLKTVPDFERLYEDAFFPTVDYFLATGEGKSEISGILNMPDVVTSSDIESLADAPAGGPETAAEEPAKSIDEAIEVEAEQIAAEAGLEPADEDVGISEEELEAARKSLTSGKAGQGAEKEPGEGEPKEEGKKEKKPERPHELQKGNVNASVLRVDSRRIDSLLNLISEAVINKATFNQISTQFTEALGDFQSAEAAFKEKQKELFEDLPEYLQKIHDGVPIKTIKKEIWEAYGDIFTLFDAFESKLKNTINDFRGTSQILGRNTSELHEKVLQIRMVPISQIFSRFPRLVRDVSKSLDKKIRLIIEGEDTELDKSVIEDLLDPLIHCVRNAVDHGVETPEERKKAGKPEEGKVLLKASNEGNMIIIEISDDGKGIDVESVRKKAADRGLIHPNKTLSDVEAFSLIFEPGFSTAKEITNISGRGVGLDVVKKQIEKLNGQVSIVSSLGSGTRMTIKLPLTLAIIQGLLVRVGTEIYAIPITSVLDSHRIRPEEIKRIDNYEVFNVREDVISLIRLDQLFGIRSDESRKYHFVVIVGSGDKKMGLMVDSLIGEEDVVIKPLRDKYTNSPGIAGATILGDGTVSLIIDVSQLLDLGLRKEKEQRRLRGARSTS